MKNFVPLVALIFGSYAGCQRLAHAQTAAQPANPIVSLDSQKSLIGQKFGGWVIPRKHWTNTRQPVWLGGLQGKITVIEFFRTGCSHCEQAAPARRALWNKYRSKGLKMVGFQAPGDLETPANPELNWKQVQRTIKKWGLTYPIAFDENRAFFDSNGFQFYPTVLVLDKRGIVRFQQIGYDESKAAELDNFVAEMLKTP